MNIYIYSVIFIPPSSSVKQFSGAAGRDHPILKVQAAPGTGWHGSRNGLARNESWLRWPAVHLGIRRPEEPRRTKEAPFSSKKLVRKYIQTCLTFW